MGFCWWRRRDWRLKNACSLGVWLIVFPRWDSVSQMDHLWGLAIDIVVAVAAAVGMPDFELGPPAELELEDPH